MFSSKTQLQKRTPQDGTDRESFLTLLVDEYLHSTSYDAKSQVLANLSNFAYDPINYVYIRETGVLDVFLYVLKNETDQRLLHFATAGICNICSDPLNADYILTHAGLKPIKALLKIKHTDIIVDAITTLLYLCNHQTKTEISTPDIVEIMSELKNSNDKRVANMATIFIEDICGV